MHEDFTTAGPSVQQVHLGSGPNSLLTNYSQLKTSLKALFCQERAHTPSGLRHFWQHIAPPPIDQTQGMGNSYLWQI